MERVTFPNRGNTVVGNLFTPAGSDAGSKYPAIVVTHPFGAVKEQVSTLYAGKLTEQGFITLVFDASYQGESGGKPHFTEIPAARVEDIRCAVDFLSTHPQADEDRIGALGICAGGGYTRRSSTGKGTCTTCRCARTPTRGDSSSSPASARRWRSSPSSRSRRSPRARCC